MSATRRLACAPSAYTNYTVADPPACPGNGRSSSKSPPSLTMRVRCAALGLTETALIEWRGAQSLGLSCGDTTVAHFPLGV